MLITAPTIDPPADTLEQDIRTLSAVRDGTEIADAIKARCEAVIKQHDNVVKDRIIQMAKDQGHKIARKDISNIKVEKINGGYADWGTKLISLKSVDGDIQVDKTITHEGHDENDGPNPSTYEFEFSTDETLTTSWTFNVGVKIKGGTAMFSGYEIDFGAEFATIKTETVHLGWHKTITVSPHARVTAYAILQKGHGKSTVTGTFEIKKGTARISCDIKKFGTHHRAENINLTDILYTTALRRFVSQGTFETDLDLKAITSNSEEPL